jgi:hypothetical protein
MLFEELIEQPDVNLLITDAAGFSFAVTHHQVGIHLFHFLSHEDSGFSLNVLNPGSLGVEIRERDGSDQSELLGWRSGKES